MGDGMDFKRGHGPYGSRRQKVVDPMRERTQLWLEKHLGDLARFVQLGTNEFPDALANLLSQIERETRRAAFQEICLKINRLRWGTGNDNTRWLLVHEILMLEPDARDGVIEAVKNQAAAIRSLSKG